MDGLQMSVQKDEECEELITADDINILEAAVPSIPLGYLVKDHLLSSSAKQTLLFDLIGQSHSWSSSKPNGTLTFGKKSCCGCLPLSVWLVHLPINKIGTFQIQVLGTMAPNGWLWSWMNPTIPKALTMAASELKKNHPLVPEFQADAIESVSIDGAHSLCLVAVGLTRGAHGYYVGSTGANVLTFYMLTHDCDGILPNVSVSNAFHEETPALIHFVFENMNRLGTPLGLNHLETFLTKCVGISRRLPEPPNMPGREPAEAAFEMKNGDVLLIYVRPDGTLKSMACLVFAG